jgi:hypothetical protein
MASLYKLFEKNENGTEPETAKNLLSKLKQAFGGGA